jgi:diaminohydroxyphosphoribosylaminopyrimidine deaminase/5-amino-6-(5-phosphoribosylamino)uracil reductase
MTDELYLQRCLELAHMGMAKVSPNPMVGCVIVSNGKVIGEGYHAKFGAAHAEVNALQSVMEKYGDAAPALLATATAYVSLEPCAHFGKTPPCADLLIRHRIKKVVIGNLDPFDGVNGKGIAKLKNAGIEVVSGILAAQCTQLNRRFFTRIQQQRPYVILKWAETANGYFAPLNQAQQWITGSEAKTLVHKWRTEEDAVLVGKNTALVDNPELTARNWPGKNPIRIALDQNLEIPATHQLYNKAAKTLIFNEQKTEVNENIHFLQMEDMQHYLPQKIAYQLYLMDVQSIIIEGGANILRQFIKAGLWDEARVFHSRENWKAGIPSPELSPQKTNIIDQFPVGKDQLTIYKNNPS